MLIVTQCMAGNDRHTICWLFSPRNTWCKPASLGKCALEILILGLGFLQTQHVYVVFIYKVYN